MRTDIQMLQMSGPKAVLSRSSGSPGLGWKLETGDIKRAKSNESMSPLGIFSIVLRR